MKRFYCLTLMLIALLSVSTKVYAEEYPATYWGKYGLNYQKNLVEYKKMYVGKTVKYVTGSYISPRDEDFPGIIGKEYVVIDVKSTDEIVTIIMQEKDGKKKIKMPIRIANFISSWTFSFRNTFNMDSENSAPLLLVDELNKDKEEYIGRIYSEENITKFEIVDLYLTDEHYPSVKFKIKNHKTGMTFDIDAVKHMNDLKYLGKVYRHPKFKGYYEVVGIEYEKKTYGEKKEIPYLVLKNSLTGGEHTFKAESAEYECFEEDLRGKYVATLVQVEKPSDENNRYGNYEIVKDSLDKYHYADNNINMAIGVSEKKINFILENVSQHSLKIIWNDAVYVDTDGSTSKIMHNGVRYINRDDNQPASTIIRGAKLEETIVPNSKVYRNRLDQWDEYPLFLWEKKDNIPPVRLMLPIQVKDVVNEYIFVFEVKYQYVHPERILE